jgi:Protein of unknown function (DUF998)
MHGLSVGTFKRPEDMGDSRNPAVLYVRSYLLIRTAVGFIGILLPFALIIGEHFFLKGGVQVRGSLSAYYHSSMQDIFVGSLCVVGFLLITYMAGKPGTWDFWLSLIAGVFVLVVVFFPTSRPDIASGAPLCGSSPVPPGCSPVEQALGETPTATVHFVAAVIFLICLAGISFLFGHREEIYNHRNGWRLFHISCGIAILAAIVFAAVGGVLKADIGPLTPLYLGEVVSVWAFGASWLIKGKDLRGVLHVPGRRQ